MIDKILQQECDLEFFHSNGYIRKKCKSCGDYFWTLDKDTNLCGDQPCVPFSFIGNKDTTPLTLAEVRKSFLSFFQDNNHSVLHYPETGNRCPVIARWRSDIYLTIASIADFQPHVTSGVVPAPANPLVISQPCIRLNDLDEVGVSGRHLTMFEMMGHHAFNKNIDEIYWKENTVAYCDTYFKEKIGIPRKAINYKEQLWIGGGNAGPCIEVLAGGLEIATLVFMNMKEDRKGSVSIEGKTYTQNPLNIVDTGYGLERIAWYTTGTPTVYETAFPEMLSFIKNNITKGRMETIYALADHTKCLAFMLGDGIVPSNVKAGYLARLIIRRSLRLIEKLRLNHSLKELVGMQVDFLKKDFPSLKKGHHQIDEILDVETKRFSETLSKGEGLVKRIIQEHKTIGKQDLIMLYDTHGMPPEVVQQIALQQGVTTEIPKAFDSMIAELHSHEKKEEQEETIRSNLPKTEALYYNDHYLKTFTAKVIWMNATSDGTEVILDKTVFYPEGGGQPTDVGTLEINGKKVNVIRVVKEGDALIHHLEGSVHVGDTVVGTIDWDNRYMLMKHHTGTHLVNGALRKHLGEHIWQAGSQLAVHEARFDFSHYSSLSDDDIKEVERLANEFIHQEQQVEKKVMERNKAEQTYGFRLYQGGVPPGNCIRVLHIPHIDVEACGGMHVDNTKEIEQIRILKTERIQDGVNRIIFAVGQMVNKFEEEERLLYQKLIGLLNHLYQITKQEDVSEQLKAASRIFSVPSDQLEKTIQRFIQESGDIPKTTVVTFSDACSHLFSSWKQSQKMKKMASGDELVKLQEQAESIPGTTVKVITGKSVADATATAGKLIKQAGLVVHIYDGKKLTSAASDDVDIDLRDIAPQLGKLLGGSGGGKPKMTQAGGPKKEMIENVFTLAKELTKKQLTS